MNPAPQHKHENGVFDTSILMLKPDTLSVPTAQH
jgi:hypothetical protein